VDPAPVSGSAASDRPVTVRQCAVLVGGLGSRLGVLTAGTPKPLLPCGDRPFLAWLLRELLRFGVEECVLLAGHLADAVERDMPALAAMLPKPVRIMVSRETVRAGTGGAIFHARAVLAERFLLCNGDSLFRGNLAPLLAEGACDGLPTLGRVLLCATDDVARYGTVRLEAGRVTAFGAPTASGGAGMVNAGVYLFDRRLVDTLSPTCSLEGDVLPRLAAAGGLRGTLGEGGFLDIGVPEDLARAQRELPRLLRRRALFLDRDGVVNVDHGYVGSCERFEWMQGALAAIGAATDAGWHVFVVTNQSGVARGRYDEAAVVALHAWMADETRRAGGTIDDIRYCPFHPDAAIPAYRRASDWRKPAPGMLLDLMRAWELDAECCVLVGDQETDMQAAAAAGMRGFRFTGGNLLEFLRPILNG
jgi:D,D-heptose 1,7-bisphosphate phosphatase